MLIEALNEIRSVTKQVEEAQMPFRWHTALAAQQSRGGGDRQGKVTFGKTVCITSVCVQPNSMNRTLRRKCEGMM